MRKSSEGYTLIEVMAALSLLMIIILFLVSFEAKYFKNVYISNKTKEYAVFMDALEKEIRNNMPKELRVGTRYIEGDKCNISWLRSASVLSLGSYSPVGGIYAQINFLSGRGGIIIYDKNLPSGSISKEIYFY